VQAFLSLGRLHLPVFGLFAAAGLIAAMTLSQYTARPARVDASALWDTGMVAVFSAFLLSRVLLVAENFRLFLQYPLLVLELPSLTASGVVLTAVLSYYYLRRRGLRLLGVLDAAAPCAALLAASVEMGRMADGTHEGMPTKVRWAIESPFGRVHPVELYSAIAWLALCAVLLRVVRVARREGETAAWGLVLGGLVIFGMDFFRLPSEMYGAGIFDRVQWRAIALMVAGGGMLAYGLVAPVDVRGDAAELPRAEQQCGGGVGDAL
jgi:phosphatidylglycerol:prolipoprotein diacylglycerol transferase